MRISVPLNAVSLVYRPPSNVKKFIGTLQSQPGNTIDTVEKHYAPPGQELRARPIPEADEQLEKLR